jgi:hypothetical protein
LIPGLDFDFGQTEVICPSGSHRRVALCISFLKRESTGAGTIPPADQLDHSAIEYSAGPQSPDYQYDLN